MKPIYLIAAIAGSLAAPVQAQDYDQSVEAKAFDSAVKGGNVTIGTRSGRVKILSSSTQDCRTRLVGETGEWSIGWASDFVSEGSTTETELAISTFPDYTLLRFAEKSQLPLARAAAEHLHEACE